MLIRKLSGSQGDELKPGDVFVILEDQYGHPKLRVDPVTRKATTELRKFVVQPEKP